MSKDQKKAIVYTVDAYVNGIDFGREEIEASEPFDRQFNLKLLEDREIIKLRGRFALNRKKPRHELEKHLIRISQRGELGRSTIYLGFASDPFHPFEGKFDASMRFLKLFSRYTPGRLIIQTRSPLVVLAMPMIRALGERCIVTMGIETPLEESVRRYTPGLPRVAERLKAIRALRQFGVKVQAQVAPVLPYGDWKKDADEFAEVLAKHSDYISIASITDGTEPIERRLRRTSIGKRLAEDRKFHWLRKDSAAPLLDAVSRISPEKLEEPSREYLEDKQLGFMFA